MNNIYISNTAVCIYIYNYHIIFIWISQVFFDKEKVLTKFLLFCQLAAVFSRIYILNHRVPPQLYHTVQIHCRSAPKTLRKWSELTQTAYRIFCKNPIRCFLIFLTLTMLLLNAKSLILLLNHSPKFAINHFSARLKFVMIFIFNTPAEIY